MRLSRDLADPQVRHPWVRFSVRMVRHSVVACLLLILLSILAGVINGEPRAGDHYHPVIHELDGTRVNIDPNYEFGE